MKDVSILCDWMVANSALTIDVESLTELCSDMVYQRYIARDTIVRQGDVGDSFFIILNGIVEVLVDRSIVCHLTAGQSFGEIALLQKNSRRNATVRVPRDCAEAEFAQISATPYHQFVAQQHVREHKLKLGYLKNMRDIFQAWTHQDIDDLAHRLQTRKIKNFECPKALITSGDSADAFYFLAKGQVTLRKRFTIASSDVGVPPKSHESHLTICAPTFLESMLFSREDLFTAWMQC